MRDENWGDPRQSVSFEDVVSTVESHGGSVDAPLLADLLTGADGERSAAERKIRIGLDRGVLELDDRLHLIVAEKHRHGRRD